MSKLPRINSTRQDSTFNISENTENSIKIPQTPQININGTGRNLSPLLYESKLTQLETKILNLEQTNEILLNRIGQNEIKFNIKIQDLENKTKSNFMNGNNIIEKNDNNQLIDMNEINNIKTKINLFENLFDKQEQWKVNQRKKDLEMYKMLLEKLNASISQTVQLEITERFKGDIANRNEYQKFFGKYENDINEIKRSLYENTILLKNNIMEVSNENSERIQNLTKYIDIQIDKINQRLNDKTLHVAVQKLADQIKKNLENQIKVNNSLDERITSNQKIISKIQEEIKINYNDIEKRLINKIMEIKQFAEINIGNSHKMLNRQMVDMSNKMSTNINFLIQQLISLSNEIKNQFENDRKLSDERFMSLIEDLEQVLKRQFQVEDSFNKNLDDYKKLYEKCENKLKDFKIEFDVNIVNERLVRYIELNEINDRINQTNNILNQFSAQSINNMNLMNQNTNEISNKIIERINYLQNILNQIIENNLKRFSKLDKESSEIQTKQILNEMIFKLEENDILNQISKLKGDTIFLGNNLKDNTKSINKIDNQISSIIKTLSESGGEMGNMKDIIKEKEQKEEIEKIMNDIVSNIENSLLENKLNLHINELTNEINSNFQNNKNEILSLKKEIERLTNESNQLLEEQMKNNKSKMGMNEQEVKSTLQQILNKVEFQNIYSILNGKGNVNIKTNDLSSLQKQIIENNEITKKALVNYSDVIDNKINNVIERFKKENIDMWTNAVQLSQKYTQPEEIKKLISEIPPTIIPEVQSQQEIMNLGFEHDNPSPIVGDLDDVKGKVEEERYGKNNSKASSKKESVKNE